MNLNKEQILDKIKTDLGDNILDFFEKNKRRFFVEVKPEEIKKTITLLFKELNARFSIASGVDTYKEIEILYHFAFDSHDFVLTIKTKLNRDNPEIDSVACICKGIEWIEREMWELLGINFKNHPDLRHLLLKEDWPEGKYPLRRDYITEKEKQ